MARELKQEGSAFWVRLAADGTVEDGNYPEGTVGFAWANPTGDLAGFFGDESVALAEQIAKEDSGLIVWLA
jgi:hypothetical protein